MSSVQARTADIAYLAAADRHWQTAGSTRPRPEPGTPRAQRTEASVPLNLTVYDIAENHRAQLAQFVARHTATPAPTSRDTLSQYAAAVAEQNATARDEYDSLQFASTLRMAMEIGDANEILGKITCPSCSCWSLIPYKLDGTWQAACMNLNCAPTPHAPRTWSVAAVARHHTDMAA